MGWLEKVLPALEEAGIEVDFPEDWGAEIDYGSWAEDLGEDALFVHWGGSQVRETAEGGSVAAERATLRDWESYHVHQKGWRGIAYDGGIGNSGRFYVLRGNGRSAATSGDVDEDGIPNNAESEAVVLLVGKGQTVSDAALATLKVVADASQDDRGDVYGHREAGGIATECPGDQAQDWVNDYRAGRLDDDGPAEEPAKPKPAPSGDTVIGAIVDDLPVLKRQTRYREDPNVKTVQAQATYRWGLPTKIDGYFGPDTERKVREIQQRAHTRDSDVMVGGIVGPQSWALLLLGRLPN